MTITTTALPASDEVEIRFTLDAHDQGETVSVVGSFNDWTPGTHLMQQQDDGTYSVSITVSADADVHFRYLADGGAWFDDPDADEVTADGSIIRLSRPTKPL